jgi:hypothetical protein
VTRNVKLIICTAAFLSTFGVQAATIVVTNTADTGAGSLRAAITSANATSEADIIHFNIPNTDPGFQTATQHWRIDVSSAALPRIDNDLIIDGYSQPGATPNTNTPAQGGSNAVLKIELRNTITGFTANGIDGSSNFSPQLVVRGLAIHSFFAQVVLAGTTPQRVEGCFLGTTIDGTADANPSNNGQTGVSVQGNGAYRIGGLTPDTRNVIAGDGTGISFLSSANGVRIEGNLIGSNAAGTVGISPRAVGIAFNSSMNTIIGGTDPNARNLISGNGFEGLRLFGDASATSKVIGNYFGTDWTGTRAIPNGTNPFSVTQPQPNVLIGGTTCPLQLGGAAPGEANVFAFSPVAGVRIDRCTNSAQRNRFLGNAVALDNVNGGGFPGATPNDAGDPDTGGNRMQNFPVLSLPPEPFLNGGSSVNLSYLIDTLPANATYPITVEFYRSACGGGGSGVPLGSDSYVASNAGTSKTFTLSAADGGSILPLLALAIDAAGNASEFSPAQGEAIFRQDFEDVLGPETPGICR